MAIQTDKLCSGMLQFEKWAVEHPARHVTGLATAIVAASPAACSRVFESGPGEHSAVDLGLAAGRLAWLLSELLDLSAYGNIMHYDMLGSGSEY